MSPVHTQAYAISIICELFIMLQLIILIFFALETFLMLIISEYEIWNGLVGFMKNCCDLILDLSCYDVGNVESLKSGTKDDITRVFKELVNFHKAFYSANIMCLVVIGKGVYTVWVSELCTGEYSDNGWPYSFWQLITIFFMTLLWRFCFTRPSFMFMFCLDHLNDGGLWISNVSYLSKT